MLASLYRSQVTWLHCLGANWANIDVGYPFSLFNYPVQLDFQIEGRLLCLTYFCQKKSIKRNRIRSNSIQKSWLDFLRQKLHLSDQICAFGFLPDLGLRIWPISEDEMIAAIVDLWRHFRPPSGICDVTSDQHLRLLVTSFPVILRFRCFLLGSHAIEKSKIATGSGVANPWWRPEVASQIQDGGHPLITRYWNR